MKVLKISDNTVWNIDIKQRVKMLPGDKFTDAEGTEYKVLENEILPFAANRAQRRKQLHYRRKKTNDAKTTR